MKRIDLFEELIDILDLELSNINEDTLVAIDSLSTLSLIAFLDEHFQIQVNAEQLSSIQKIGDLVELIGNDKLEE